MIIPMAKVRVMGPRARLPATLRALQDFGLMHLADASEERALLPVPLTPRQQRLQRQLRRTLDDIDAVLVALHAHETPPGRPMLVGGSLAVTARRARRTRREAERIAQRAAALAEERGLILKYRDFFANFESALRHVSHFPNLTTYAVVVPRSEHGVIDELRKALGEAVGAEFSLNTFEMASGDIAMLLVLPKRFGEQLERMLAGARLPEVPIPAAYGGRSLAEAVPKMLERLREIPAELQQLARERRALTRASLAELLAARAPIHDCLAEIEATLKVGATAHAFAIEGWLPAEGLEPLQQLLTERFEGEVVAAAVARERWTAADAPVVLSNPRLFKPFESLIRLMPLPRYGTIDPTPFVAVVFPLMVGIILGDVGYGALLGALALFIHRRARAGSLWRTAAEVAGPCAAFAIIFGVLFGELFGDLGRRWLGMQPILFDREESAIAALAVAVGIGVVHVVLGLILGAVTLARHEPRHALGKGISAVMVLLIVIALLAAFDLLPRTLFTPAVIVILVAFPVLVIAEGFIAPIELLSTLGNILSYARIMALGTASVMLAVVANRMVGAVGSTAVGVVFALLFHLVNFGIGLFSPTIHALRLHYVEFFGKFYSPGGLPYRPFAHWSVSPSAR